LLDEWQEVPGVLGSVKRAVDADFRPGRFIRLPMTVLTEREVNRSDLGKPGFFDRLAKMDLSTSTKTSNLNIINYVGLAVRGSFPEVVGVTSERIRSS
jgi:hypothetical protein